MTAYNAAHVVGWLLALVLGGLAWLKHGPSITGPELWQEFGKPVTCFQLLMILDVVHAAIGLVRSSVMTTAMQIASRVIVVAILLTNKTASSTVLGLTLILCAWCPTEILRYSYYIVKDLCPESIPSFLTWLRYNTFFVLYPVGISGEILIMYSSLAGYRESADLQWMQYVIYAIFVIYVPGAIYLYAHMIKQRKGRLSKTDAQKKLN